MEGVKFDGVILFYDLILHQFMPNMEVYNIKEAILSDSKAKIITK